MNICDELNICFMRCFSCFYRSVTNALHSEHLPDDDKLVRLTTVGADVTRTAPRHRRRRTTDFAPEHRGHAALAGRVDGRHAEAVLGPRNERPDASRPAAAVHPRTCT